MRSYQQGDDLRRRHVRVDLDIADPPASRVVRDDRIETVWRIAARGRIV